MTGWLKRAGTIVLAAVGLLVGMVIGLGFLANTLVGIVQFVAALPLILWVGLMTGIVPILYVLWLRDRRRL